MSSFLASLRGKKPNPEVTEADVNWYKENCLNQNGTPVKPTKELIESYPKLSYTLIVIWTEATAKVEEQKHKEKFQKLSDDKKNEKIVKTGRFVVDDVMKSVSANGWLKAIDLTTVQEAYMNRIIENGYVTETSIEGDGIRVDEEEEVAPPPVSTSDDSKAEEDADEEEDGNISLSALDLMIIRYSEGLQYDKFDSTIVRNAFLSKFKSITVKDVVIMCSAYIYVGNNQSKLTNKVKDGEIGKEAMGVLNQYDVKTKKVNQKTLTLARVGIIFSPVVWALRNILLAKGTLQSSGVTTSCPLVLQDVALSGPSMKINGGDGIKDFLYNFNKVLTKHREKASSEKTKDEAIKEESEKYHSLAQSGLSSDSLINNWDFNLEENKTSVGILKFFNMMKDQTH